MMESGTPATASINQTPIAEMRLQAPGTGTGNWTVFRTLHMPVYAPTNAERVKFQRLASQWRKDTLLSSSVGDDHAHMAHLAILAMGKPALPLILEELERNGGHWFLALRLIAEFDPVPPEHAGKVSKMREDWIRWGRQNDYL
jgi:hypothetical protein